MNEKYFNEIDIEDKFFDSLKYDYPGFENWFRRKYNQKAYVQYDNNGKIMGFLYLKSEKDIVADVQPTIFANTILKVGTFKIDAHGTRLGERFVKIIFDTAVNENADLCYVTIFPKHFGLINLLKQFGFYEYGKKGDEINCEKVFVKDMRKISGNISIDYPLVKATGVNKYLLSIYPKYHSIMFTDSILKTESAEIIKDVSYGNSIHKIYVCRMDVEILKRGDILVLYRTSDFNKIAEYSSVVTSICVVEEVKNQGAFTSFNDFFQYACQYSVFDKKDLLYWYNKGGCKIIKFTYNIALKNRLTRHSLIEKVGLDRKGYWGFFKLNDSQFDSIVELGGVNRNIIY